MTPSQQTHHDRQVATWLLVCAAVVFGMILLGGVTRLTNSGLSMVEWKPLVGVIPPLSEQAWQAVFDKYRLFPEYQKINRGMSLDAFKSIFMYEYLHRVLGRLIGVLFLLPMLFFVYKKRLRPGLQPKLYVLFFLGGLQGLLGWYMVKSGLVSNPHVSQYRLTAHFGVAVVLYGYMLWLSFDLLFRSREHGEDTATLTRKPYANSSGLMIALVFLMMLSGGLVAGTDAGLAYPTWPLMGDTFIPTGLYALTPAWLSIFEHIPTIQFNHRMFAYFLCVVLTIFATVVYRSADGSKGRWGAVFVVLALFAQISLGISTLLLKVPVPVALAHQGGAVLLLTAVLFLSHVQRRQ